MGSRYDSRTTIFSPEGRLFQVEYAMEAISKAGSAVGILSQEGVVLAAEKRITSKLLDVRQATEKLFKVDSNCSVAVAGITSDANTLINAARLEAQRYLYAYQEPMPIEQLIQVLCDTKQSYTQFGGLRPFGVSMLFAGWDRHHGFQLYQTDPSGNYGGWKAKAIGANNKAAQTILKEEYKENGEISLKDALKLSVKVLSKTMDTTAPTSDKVEISTLTRSGDGTVKYTVMNKKDLDDLLAEVTKDLSADKSKQPAASGDI